MKQLRYAYTIIEKHWLIVVALLSLFTLAVSLSMGVGQSVWFDESYSIMVAQQPIPELLDLIKVDAHPPLYYLYLKLWGDIFGWSELSLRLSSAIPGALSVGLMIIVIRRLFSVRVALMSGVFVAIAPFLTRYNYEIRMYALVTFIGVLGTWLLLKARSSRSLLWWVLYALVVALGMYTLYMTAVMWLAHVVWLVYVDISSKRNILKQKHWLFYVFAALLFVPWLPVVVDQLQNSALPPYMSRITFDTLLSAYTMVFAYEPIWEIPLLLCAVLVAILILSVWLLRHIHKRVSVSLWRGIVLLFCLSFIAIIFYTLISLPPSPPRFTDRYMVHVSIYLYALVGVIASIGFTIGKRRLAAILGVLTVGVLGYGLYSLSVTGNYNFQRLQPAYAKTIDQVVDCRDTTIISTNAYGYIDMWHELQGCDLRYYQPTDFRYTGGYALLNDLRSKRVTSTTELNAPVIAVVHFDDSEDQLQPDERYTLDKEYDYQGLKLLVYRRSMS